MSDINDRGYAQPEALVSTQWVAEHKDDPDVRIIESNEDLLLYSLGHIEGAVEIDWTRDLNDQLTRDYLDEISFAKLMSRCGISPNTKVIFYGDRNNWWAAYALWVFSLFGHTNCAIMDGGRLKWIQEGRDFVKERPNIKPAEYPTPKRDDSKQRAFRDQVMWHIKARGMLIDVRSPAEFTGERLHMAEYPNEGALRGGHIPGARNVPWALATDPSTGEFLPAANLRNIYEREAGLSPNDEVIVYCRIGERSSLTWFALHFLLGYQKVRNYDGSWTEWGNMVGVPIER